MGPPPDEAQRERVACLRGVSLCSSEYKLEWMQHPWADVDAAGAWLLDLASQFRPDLVHLNGYSHAVLPWNAPTLVVAHSCVYSWWEAVHGEEPPHAQWAEYHARVKNGLLAADAVVTPSSFMRNALYKHYGLNPSRARVILNFSELAASRPARKEPFFLAAGRKWDVGKNLHFLSDIQERLLWPLQTADGLPHAAVLDAMQRASVFVHPALYEPFGLAVLEAAHAGCCLVLSDIPSLRELWDGAALFADPRDPGAWVDALNRVASGESRCESLAQAAREHATRYSADRTLREYLDVYASLLASQRKGAAA
jgi:glycosyltransferase involved in cell wall biosynthesis